MKQQNHNKVPFRNTPKWTYMKRYFSRHWISVAKGNASWAQPEPDNFSSWLLLESFQTAAQEEGNCRMLELRLHWEYRKTKKDRVCNPEFYGGKNTERKLHESIASTSPYLAWWWSVCACKKTSGGPKEQPKMMRGEIFSVQTGTEKWRPSKFTRN